MTARTRIGLVAGLTLTGMGTGWATGLTEQLSPTVLQAWLVEAGPLGVVAFVALFTGGTLMGVPGLVFLFAALLAWGPLHGAGVAMVGAVVALSVNFAVIRAVGGDAGASVEARWARWALDRVEDRPLLATAMLRATTVLAPPVTAALALSSIRYREYLLGSVVGLVVPIVGYALSFECLVAKLLA